jgi:hypothetical protein
LRQHALHQRFHRYVSLRDYIPGPANTMADDASRRFDLSDADLLTHFNATYPQAHPWHLYRPKRNILSSATSALHKQPSPRALFLQTPMPPLPTGPDGPHSAPPSPSILPFIRSRIPSHTSRSSLTGTAPEPLTPANAWSAAAPWRVPYAALAKRLRVWGPRTPGSHPRATSTSA